MASQHMGCLLSLTFYLMFYPAFVCLFVCLSVSNFTRDYRSEIRENFYRRCICEQGTDYIQLYTLITIQLLGQTLHFHCFMTYIVTFLYRAPHDDKLTMTITMMIKFRNFRIQRNAPPGGGLRSPTALVYFDVVLLALHVRLITAYNY